MANFKQKIDRRNTDSVKWHVGTEELPMTIADMEFQTSPAILMAMQKKIEFGIFGYEEPGADYFTAVVNWYKSQHSVVLQTDWMLFCTGVVPAISSIVRRISHVGDNVVVQPPVYDIFYHSIENNGRHVLANNLSYDQHKQSYAIDWGDLAEKLADPLTTLMILCNPHNPIGKVWCYKDLLQLVRLCDKYNVTLVSDEIHGDLVLGEPHYTSICRLPTVDLENVIALVSPSKTFNVAALHAATAIIPNGTLRSSVSRGLNNDEIAEPNLLALPATIAAYEQGSEWLQSLKQRLKTNREIVKEFIEINLPEITLVSENATYLLWFDVSQLTDNADKLTKSIAKHTGLLLTSGNVYRGNGAHFIRMNTACSPSMLQDGLTRLYQGVKKFKTNPIEGRLKY